MQPRVRLGAGDFVPTGAPNPFARARYLRAVARCVPEALRTLAALDPANEAHLLVWAERWGFTDEWTLRHARNQVKLWSADPQFSGRWMVFPATAFWAPVFEAPQWDSTKETEAAHRKRHDAYIATIKRAKGFQRTPEKSDDRHFEWTALYHVGGCKQPQIAERYQEEYPTEYDGLTPGTVSGAIKSVAKLIGLTLRRKQGRPRKNFGR